MIGASIGMISRAVDDRIFAFGRAVLDFVGVRFPRAARKPHTNDRRVPYLCFVFSLCERKTKHKKMEKSIAITQPPPAPARRPTACASPRWSPVAGRACRWP